MAHSSRDDSSFVASAPVHPVAQLQGPFDESMLESAYDTDDGTYPDPVTRRNTLLESPTYVRVVAGRWKQKPGERFHPLWKLIAQISFGVHLLAEGMARSEDDVMQILQAHVDEIDGFLERTTEDFDLAQEDIQERLRCLKLPLSHPATFDKMLEDRNFRLSIVDGNEKIEHIVDRTTQAMKDSLKDVQKGYESTTCLENYLQTLAQSWTRLSVEHEAVFVAMLGNVEGWRKAFNALHTQGTKLNSSLKKLTDIINEMQARAGEVSRRLLHQAKVQPSQVVGAPTGRSTPTSKYAAAPKQLPGMPGRPGLKQVASNDTVPSTSSSTRMSSQETLRRQAMLGRSQTPQRNTPSPNPIQRSNSPQLVDIGGKSQTRIQSPVPSLLGALPSPDVTRTAHQAQPSVDSQPEKYFPPVELPAHVPEETMQNMPMSKQNRLSLGLSKVGARLDKRESRLGTSALIDLLRAGPPGRSNSPEASRRGSAVKPAAVQADIKSGDRGVVSQAVSSPRSGSTSDNTTFHTKNNIRRPQKGAKHWFDAVDDEPDDDYKYSVVGDDRINNTVITVHPSQQLNLDSHPGTPAWAVTTFAQVEKRKELLKQGAFKSHPPELPLGSPPVANSRAFPNPLGVVEPQRKLSHSSSTTGQSTLGEPGPEVAASEAGSSSGRHRNYDSSRASAYAPEVVMTEGIPPLPPPKKQFVAEMEGSSPHLSRFSSNNSGIIELEAPRHHFVLPPRPLSQTTIQSTTSPRPHQQHFVLPPRPQQTQSSQPNTPYQQHFVLPPRPQPRHKQTTPKIIESRIATPEPAILRVAEPEKSETQRSNVEKSEQEIPISPEIEELPRPTSQKLDLDPILSSVTTVVEATPAVQPDVLIQSEQFSYETNNVARDVIVEAEEVTEQFANYKKQDEGERLPSSVYVPTPNIPIPPSPFGDSTYLQANESQRQSSASDSLYILPAIAYKAPISPSLPPDPVLRRKPLQQPSETSGLAKVEPSPKPEQTSDVSAEAFEVQPVMPAIESPQEPDLVVRAEDKSITAVDAASADTQTKSDAEESERTEAKEQSTDEPSIAHETVPDATLSNQEEYDPFRASPLPPKETSAEFVRLTKNTKVTPIKIVTSTRQEDNHKQDGNAGNVRHPSVHGSTNEWKAFFTGQPSPVGSTLSIRSIRRESYMEPAQPSPALLSPASASSAHPFPTSPLGPAVKEAVWFSMGNKRGSDTSGQAKEPVGLGITTLAESEKVPVSAS